MSSPKPTNARGWVSVWLQANGVTALLLLGIVFFGLALRLQNLNWDEGQHLHPDERFFSIIESQIRLPSNLGQYFDSADSPLNPYQQSNTFVYGTFPLFLNKVVANWLSPNADGHISWTARAFESVTGVLGVHYKHANGTFMFNDGYDSQLVGRVLSSIFDVFTIVLVFEFARLLFDKRVGLVAAGLLSINVLHIQYSHFFGAETFLAFFVTAVVYFSARMLKRPSPWNYAGAGVAYGFALACKLSALPVLVIPALAVLITIWPQLEAAWRGMAGVAAPWRRGEEAASFQWERVVWPLYGAVGLLICTGVVFRVLQPYAFNGPGFFGVFRISLNIRHDLLSASGWRHLEIINPTNYFDFAPKFVADIAALRVQQTGADFPPNMQWIGRPFIVFPLRNIFFFGLGPMLSVAVGASGVLIGYRALKRGDLAALLPLIWAVFFFLFIARTFVPTMRYFITIYPSMVVIGAFGLVTAWDWAASGEAAAFLGRQRRLLAGLARFARPAVKGAVALVLALSFLWAMFFMGIYRQEISRAQASRWMHENIPQGSTLSFQEWDDGIPLNLPGLPPSNVFQSVKLTPYAQDSPEKVQALVAGLDKIDYVVETSNRLYDSIPRIPARYPSTTLYYKYLFDGTLGFEKVAEFHNYPQLFGINIHDQWAEEAFTVYDHPKVTIWKKTSAYSHDRAIGLLNPSLAADSVAVVPGDAATNALKLRPDDLATQQQGGTWDDIFSSSGIAHDYPALVWLIVLELAAFAVTPFALLLFRRLPDRGYLLAKPLGLVLLAYPVWLIVSLKAVHFTQATIAVWLLVLLAGGVALAIRFREQMLEAFRRHWRVFLFGEALFLLAFFMFYEFRLANPDLWHPYRGGEKPMDLAYLTAVTRSTTLPPYDPWFAGGYINYYYLGQFFTGTLSKLTTIVPEVAFNLAVPTFFSLTVAGAFSVCYNLSAAARSLLKRRPNGRPIPAWSVAAAGLLGALLVTVVGNLDSVGEMVDRLSAISSWHIDSSIPLVAPVLNSIGGIWQMVVHGAHFKQPFDYWRPSRMMPPTISITEFPYFSFLFADLHAHMMAIPFDMLAIGVSAGLALTRRGERGAWREWLLVALAGVVVGALRWENSWDYPPFLLLAIAAIVIGERHAEGGLARAGFRTAAKIGLLIVVSFAAFYPFLANYTSPVSGVHRSLETTPLHQYLAHFGLFLAAVGAWLLWQFLRSFRHSSIARVIDGGREGYRTYEAKSVPGRLSISAALTTFATVIARVIRSGLAGYKTYEGMSVTRQLSISAVLTAFATVVFLALLLVGRDRTTIAAMVVMLPVVAYLAVRELMNPKPDSGVKLFVLALLGLAFGLSLGVDLVTINGDIQRMNTVFKFYLHIWLLLGIAASFAIWYLAFVVWQPGHVASVRLPTRAFKYGGAVAITALVACAAIYPIAATGPRLNERFTDLPPTLDGTAYMRTAVYNDAKGPINLDDDYEGIQWLRHNVQGTPVIMEASLQDLYRWGSRFSIYTGLPDVMGWDWHQKQQRGQFGGPIIDRRVLQVRTFYQNPDSKQAISTLAEFNVKYVIVGEVEKLYYGDTGLSKFANGLDGTLQVAYSNSTLTIYRVVADREQLAVMAATGAQ